MSSSFRIVILFAACLAGLTYSAPAAVITVSGGGEGVLSAAIGGAAEGDIVEIQDSLVYTEAHMIYGQWKANMTLCAKDGEKPEINFNQTEAMGGLAPIADGIRIGTNEGGQLIIRSKLDGYYGITANNMPDDSTLRIEHCKFTGADGNGRNQWMGGGVITNTHTRTTTNIENCDFYDISDTANNPFAIYACPAADTGSTLNLLHCRFNASVEGGACQYIFNPNPGSTVNIDGCSFRFANYHLNAGAGTVNVIRCTFERAQGFTYWLYPNSPTVNTSYSAFWNSPNNFFIYAVSGNPQVVTLNVDHCDFFGDAAHQGGQVVACGGDSKAQISVTNCNIGVNPQFTAGTTVAGFSATYANNNLFGYPKNISEPWTDGGGNLTVDAGTALTPNYYYPPKNWRYSTAAGLLTADAQGGPMGSMMWEKLLPVELSSFEIE